MKWLPTPRYVVYFQLAFGGIDRFRQVVRKAKDRGLPMQIGVNAGSLEREFNEKYGFPCPPATPILTG